MSTLVLTIMLILMGLVLLAAVGVAVSSKSPQADENLPRYRSFPTAATAIVIAMLLLVFIGGPALGIGIWQFERYQARQQQVHDMERAKRNLDLEIRRMEERHERFLRQITPPGQSWPPDAR